MLRFHSTRERLLGKQSWGWKMASSSFDFSDCDHGWVAGFADYDVDEPAKFQLEHGFRARPVELGPGGSLFISGMNRSDDLFMYYKKKLSGLPRSSPCSLSFSIELASKYISEVGVGGNPGLGVTLKGCASKTEPVLGADGRLDIDIGAQQNPGSDSTVLGHIDKPVDGTDRYVLIQRGSEKRLKSETAADGSLWVLIGSDSGYEGKTALYYTKFEIEIAA